MALTLKKNTSVFASNQALFFRDTSPRGLLFAGLIFACVAGYAALPKGTAHNWLVVLIPGALSLLLMGWAVRQTFYDSGNRWLMAIEPAGIYVNPSYCAGYSAGQSDAPVLLVPYESIRYIGCIQEVMRLPHRLGATRHHFGYLDIALRRPAQEDALLTTLYCHEAHASAGKSGPFPVRFVSPYLLRLHWNAVAPSEKVAVEHLAKECQVVGKRKVFFPDWDRLSSMQKDIYLDELWAMGMREEALFLARIHLKVSLKQSDEVLRARFVHVGQEGENRK